MVELLLQGVLTGACLGQASVEGHLFLDDASWSSSSRLRCFSISTSRSLRLRFSFSRRGRKSDRLHRGRRPHGLRWHGFLGLGLGQPHFEHGKVAWLICAVLSRSPFSWLVQRRTAPGVGGRLGLLPAKVHDHLRTTRKSAGRGLGFRGEAVRSLSGSCGPAQRRLRSRVSSLRRSARFSFDKLAGRPPRQCRACPAVGGRRRRLSRSPRSSAARPRRRKRSLGGIHRLFALPRQSESDPEGFGDRCRHGRRDGRGGVACPGRRRRARNSVAASFFSSSQDQSNPSWASAEPEGGDDQPGRSKQNRARSASSSSCSWRILHAYGIPLSGMRRPATPGLADRLELLAAAGAKPTGRRDLGLLLHVLQPQEGDSRR